MGLSDDTVESLVVAVLAVYQYSLEKAWDLRDGLRKAGLFEPESVVGKEEAQIGNLMKRAGYDRGGITYIIAPRLIGLMEAIQRGDLDELPGFVAAGDREGAVAIITSIKGFGPKSADSAWELMKPQS